MENASHDHHDHWEARLNMKKVYANIFYVFISYFLQI